MIDKFYIDSAKSIRTEFLSLNRKLEGYKKELNDLAIFLQSKADEFNKFSENEIKNIKSKSNIQGVSDKIMKEFAKIEAEEQKILRLVTPINERMEKLVKEEKILIDQLVVKYPKIKIEDIAKEIQSYLEE